MEDKKIWKGFDTSIVYDAIRLSLQCLVITILVGICMERGWLFMKDTTITITNEMFWQLYSSVFVATTPLIMACRGVRGRYSDMSNTREVRVIEIVDFAGQAKKAE